jgi:hypothetical protein
MNTQPIENARDADLRLSLQALQRAANVARELAARTGTAIVTSREGVLELHIPGSTEEAKSAHEPPAPYALGDDRV